MEDTLIALLDSFEDKRFESYRLFENYKEETLYLYKQKLNGERDRYPRGFWKGEDGRAHTRIIIDYIVEEVLGKELKDLPQILNQDFFKNNGIGGLLVYQGSSIEIIMDVYPDMFNLFEFKICPAGLWKRPDRFELARGLVDYNLEKFGYTEKDIYSVKWGKFFNYNNMANMYRLLFDGEMMKMLTFAFEGIDIIKENIPYNGKWDDDDICYIAINKIVKSKKKKIESLLLDDIKLSKYTSMIKCRFKSIENIKEFYIEHEKENKLIWEE